MLQAEIEPEARDVVRATGLPRIPQNVVGGPQVVEEAEGCAVAWVDPVCARAVRRLVRVPRPDVRVVSGGTKRGIAAAHRQHRGARLRQLVLPSDGMRTSTGLRQGACHLPLPLRTASRHVFFLLLLLAAV